MDENRVLLSQAAFSRQLGCARSYVTQLKRDDRLVMVDGKVDVNASLSKIERTGDPNRENMLAQQPSVADDAHDVANHGETTTTPLPSQDVPMVIEGNASFQDSRALKEKYLALKAKADYERNIGMLVDADGVRRLGFAMGSHLRVALENLQDQLSAELAMENSQDQIYNLLGIEFSRVLSEISRVLEKGLEVQDE